MNVLHITDFHFKYGKQNDFPQQRIIDKIIEHIHGSGMQLDFVFFTGDIVFSGDDYSDFERARKLLVERFMHEFKLNADQFFVCPGNHDVSRKTVSRAIISQIDSFKGNNELEKFIKPNEIDYKNSLLPLDNYQKFAKSLYDSKSADDIFHNGYSIHKRKIAGKTIGIYSANTSWRAVGIDDDGKLILPATFINEGLADLRDCDFKIILHHHPLSQLALYNQYEVEDLIHNNFNVAFSGHLHKDSTSIAYTNKDGILKMASAAVLADADGSTIGFTVLSFDLETLKVNGFCYKYDRQDEMLYQGKKINLQIPISIEKEKQNKFRQRLRELYDLEEDNADDLFLNGKDSKDNKGFKELWTNPVLSTKSPEEVKKRSLTTEVNSDELIKSNRSYLLMGDDKCGKTSLLKKLQLDCLLYYNIYEKVPIYIDARKFDRSGHTQHQIQKEIATYYSTSKAGALLIMSLNIVVLLIDNVDLRKDDEILWMEEVIKSFSFPQIIICTEQNSSSKYQNIKIGGEEVVNVYFHSLKKKQIRELAEKFYGNSESKTEVISRINDIFNMLAIPFNFWSVSLFMWVFKESGKDITNDVGLVDLYIESILERDRLIKNKGDFSYDKYKQYLANLSKFLLFKNDTGYCASKGEILEFTNSYLAENPRNNTNAETVWQYVENKKIVKQIRPGLYTFRLNGVFEYFLAHYLKLDPNFRNGVIADSTVYLSFKNEFEMYAGSNRGDEEFVQKIFDKTKAIFSKLNSNFKASDIDTMLSDLVIDNVALKLDSSQQELIKKSLSQEEADDISDTIAESSGINLNTNSEVKVKQFIPIDENDVVSLERALYILGKVYKNADDIKNNKLIDELFEYLINSTIGWGFLLFKSFNQETIEESDEKEHINKLIKLMKQMLPIIVQSRISDMVGANNMQAIIKSKLNSQNNEDDKSQFKRFILLYLLADIDIVNNFQYIQNSIHTIKLPILRYSILLKILYYYNFKTINLSKTIKADMEKRLQQMYTEAGGKFNKTVYQKGAVNTTFQGLDKRKLGNNDRF